MKKWSVFLMMLLGATMQFKTVQAEEQTAEEAPLMSRAEKVYNERLEKIKKERAEETNRFKKKAIANTEETRDELMKVAFGIWDHIKNKGDHGGDNVGYKKR